MDTTHDRDARLESAKTDYPIDWPHTTSRKRSGGIIASAGPTVVAALTEPDTQVRQATPCKSAEQPGGDSGRIPLKQCGLVRWLRNPARKRWSNTSCAAVRPGNLFGGLLEFHRAEPVFMPETDLLMATLLPVFVSLDSSARTPAAVGYPH